MHVFTQRRTSDTVLFQNSIIHAHRCRIVGDPYGGASELEDIPDRYNMEVKAIAKEYLDRCRRLTTACKGEAEWQG
jgi:hypothetical protein